MNINSHLKFGFRLQFSLGIIAVFMVLFSAVSAQQVHPKITEAEIRSLIKANRAGDYKSSTEASAKLSQLDIQSVPILMKILKNGNPCESVGAGGLIVELDPNNKDLVPALVNLANGATFRTLFHLREELLCRRGAAFLLPFSAAGVRALTKMLKDGDTFEKQSAIFAFDDFTETTDYPDNIRQAMKEVIPVIGALTKSKNRVLREMSNEVLGQIAGHSPQEITEIAEKYIDKSNY